MTDLQAERPAPSPEVAEYVNEHLGRYVTAMEAATTDAPNAQDIVIGFPIYKEGRGPAGNPVETEAKGIILDIMKERFLPRFPGRTMWRNVGATFEGQNFRDVVPPASGFALTHLTIPSTEPPTRGNGDVMVALVH